MPRVVIALALLLSGCVGASLVEIPLDASDEPSAPSAAPPGPSRAPGPRANVETTAGTFVIELALEKVPATVTDFITRAQAGEYDGTRFHRVLPGYLIQGGDPNTRGEDRATWGSGAPASPKPDELHPALRHDAEGTVSMATRAPDAVGSQFFITLRATPELDDRFTIIGRVVAGMDVVRAIASGPVAEDGWPADAIAIRRVTIAPPDAPVAPPERRIEAVAPFASRAVPTGATAYAAIVVRNLGDARDNVSLWALAPPGWNVSFHPPSPLALGAGAGRTVLVAIDVPPGASEAMVSVVARSNIEPAATSTASLALRALDPAAWPREGAPATGAYATLLLDGRLVDTNVEAIARDARLVPMSSVHRPRQSYEPYEFTPGVDVVPGFGWLALRTPVGATQAAWIPASMAYAEGDRSEDPLLGRDIVFELVVLSAS